MHPGKNERDRKPHQQPRNDPREAVDHLRHDVGCDPTHDDDEDREQRVVPEGGVADAVDPVFGKLGNRASSPHKMKKPSRVRRGSSRIVILR